MPLALAVAKDLGISICGALGHEFLPMKIRSVAKAVGRSFLDGLEPLAGFFVNFKRTHCPCRRRPQTPLSITGATSSEILTASSASAIKPM